MHGFEAKCATSKADEQVGMDVSRRREAPDEQSPPGEARAEEVSAAEQTPM